MGVLEIFDQRSLDRLGRKQGWDEEQALGTCGAFSGPPVHGVVCLAASKKSRKLRLREGVGL